MRALSCGLCLGILIPFLAACGDGGTGGGSTTQGGGGATSTTTQNGGSGGSGGTTTTSQSGGGGTTTSNQGAGGAGGSAGEGGTGGATGGGGSAGMGGQGGATTTSSTTTSQVFDCIWGDNCGPGKYCLAPGCQMGTCVQKPVPAGLPPEPMPVCGCDGATYWNEPTAASLGMSVDFQGSCTMVIVCDVNTPCPAGQTCNLEVTDQTLCASMPSGECWGAPISCALDGPKARACTTGTCELTCSLTKSQNPWYEDPVCSQ